MYNNYRKRQDLKRLCRQIRLQSNRTFGEGGYSAFMEKIIKNMIISKITNSNFFTTSKMLTFHKHLPPFTDSAFLPVYVKVGHNRRCKHREEILPYRIAPTTTIIHHNSIMFNIFFNIYDGYMEFCL